MQSGRDVQELANIARRATAQRADMLFKVIFAIAGALALFELNRVSDTADRVEQRQLTQMLPGLTRVEARLETIHELCCSEIAGKVKADVQINDDPPNHQALKKAK
jgi:hypothetical protein